MPNDIVIKVENLSKQYRIGSKEGYKTFRETLVDAAKAPIQQLGKLFNPTSDLRPPTSELIWALRDVSFEVKQGEVIGIIGRNGTGKSTLLKILSQITEPTEGRVELRGRVGSLLEVGTGFHPELTGHENVYLYGAILGMDRWEITRKFDEIVTFAELEKFIDTPVKRYSSGMYMRLAFAVAAHLEPEILLVDEVLAVGDTAFQKKCLGKMSTVAKEGRTVLFVSHNMAAVNALCETAILLDNGRIVKNSTASDVVSFYKERTAELVPDDGLKPGFWQKRDTRKGDGADIVAVEMVNPETAQRKEAVTTGDTVAFRLHYRSEIDLNDATFQFGISSEENVVLVNCMTQRIDGIDSPLRKGTGFIDCLFKRFPLAAGRYIIMVGIAHTMVKWLYRSSEFARLTVLPLYRSKSQRVLTSDLAYIDADHEWRMEC